MKIQSLKEIIDLSNSEISDLIINDSKFGDILKNLKPQKNINKITKNKKDNKLNSDKKLYSREIIEEDLILEEKTGKEDIFIEQNKNNLFENKSNLIFKLDEEEIKMNKIELGEDEFFLNNVLKNCEFSKEKNKKVIDDIFDFVDSEENDIQKYLLDKNLIEDNTKNNDDLLDNENEEYEESLTPLEEEIEEKEENKIIEIEKENEKHKKNQIEKNKEDNKINGINKNNNELIINKVENKTKDNNINIDIKNDKINNKRKTEININDDKNTKLFLIEKTENLTFSKEKDKSELKQYLNNKTKILEDNNKENAIKDDENKISYEITEFINKNKLSQEFMNIKLTCIFCYKDHIYIGDEEGNLFIYSLKEEKLLKQLKNPFRIEHFKKLSIKSIYSDEYYIIAGYENGKIVVYIKNEKNITKTKILESFNDISKEDIIEIKLFTKKNNVIIIYFADSKENIYKLKIVKNKIFKNKIMFGQITGELKHAKKTEPYYNIEINQFNYKCIGVVNNKAANIYVVHHFEKKVIFEKINENKNSFINFCFSLNKEEKNKFYVSYLNKIEIYELNNVYDGFAQLKTIPLSENIIQIGHFNNELIYAFTENNNIKLIYINKKNDNISNFSDTIKIDDKDLEKKNLNNADLLLDLKNHISIKNNSMFFYYKKKIMYLETLPFFDGLNKLYNSIYITKNNEIYEVLFKVIKEVYKNIHPIWQIDEQNKFKEICINYAQSYITALIVQLGNKNTNEEYTKNKFCKLIKFFLDINHHEFIYDINSSLYSFLIDNKLTDFFFFCLEPFIIDDSFINTKNIKTSFMLNLLNSFTNKDNQYINKSKSWLNEILLHFPIKNILQIEPNIVEKLLINIVLYLIINYNMDLYKYFIIDFCTPINMIMQLLREKLPTVDLDRIDLFKEENRYKDEIILSNDYLRLKLIWYIIYILKNKFEEKKSIKENKLKSNFIKEILGVLFEEKNFALIVFNELNNEKQDNNSFILIKEIFYVYQLIIDNAEILNKYYEINKEKIVQQIKSLLEKRKEFEIYLNLFMIKNILNENIKDISKDDKLILVLFFMENYSKYSDKFPEINNIEFEDNLIEILKLIDGFTIEDTEKLMKLLDKCKNSYKKLEKYITQIFKKK